MKMTTTENLDTDAGRVDDTRWRIDPGRSSVEFDVPHLLGLHRVTGHFDRFDGTLDLTRQPAIELTIDAGSVDTANGLRDKHLRAGQYFDIREHPHVRFVSDSATLDGERLRVRGRLEAAGQSIPLELDATLRRTGDELEIDAATEIDERRLGMPSGAPGSKAATRVAVRGRLVRDQSGDSSSTASAAAIAR